MDLLYHQYEINYGETGTFAPDLLFFARAFCGPISYYNDQVNCFCSKITCFEEKRAVCPKCKADSSNKPVVVLTGKGKFKVDTFYVMIDAIVANLSQKINAYSDIDRGSSFLYCDINNPVTVKKIIC